MESPWAEKLAIVAILASVAIIVVSIVWYIRRRTADCLQSWDFVLFLIVGVPFSLRMIAGIELMQTSGNSVGGV